MMRIKFTLMACCTLLMLQTAYAADKPQAKPAKAVAKAGNLQSDKPDPQQQVAVIDSVVAVVNDDVITRYELDDRLRTVVRQLQKQGTPLPEPGVLERQPLERMINDMLQMQVARESGVRVDDTQLDQAITRIAQQNNFPSLAEFRARLEEDEVDFKKFREEILSEIISPRLRER